MVVGVCGVGCECWRLWVRLCASRVQQNARHDLVVLTTCRVDQLHEDVCVVGDGWCEVWSQYINIYVYVGVCVCVRVLASVTKPHVLTWQTRSNLAVRASCRRRASCQTHTHIHTHTVRHSDTHKYTPQQHAYMDSIPLRPDLTDTVETRCVCELQQACLVKLPQPACVNQLQQ